MRERLNRIGIAPDFQAHARHFLARARDWGMSQADIDAHLEFAAGLPENLSEDELNTRYLQFADGRRLPPEISGLAMQWRQHVNNQGPDMTGTEMPLTDQDRDRLAAIEREMSKPRHESRYWQDEAMRDEYATLLERLEQRPTATAHNAADAARKAEIERVLHEDQKSYWDSDAMQREYTAILQREAGGRSSIDTPSNDQDIFDDRNAAAMDQGRE